MCIEQVIQVSGGGLKRPLIIPSDQIECEGGAKFIKLSQKHWYASTLYGDATTHKERILSKTNLFQQLAQLRNENINECVCRYRAEKRITKDRNHRLSIEERIQLPSTTTIEAPSIGDVTGITMKVIASSKMNSPVFMELTSTNIDYVRKACLWQINNYKPPRKDFEIDDIDDAKDDGEVDHRGVEDDGDVNVDGVEDGVEANGVVGQGENFETPVKARSGLISDFFK